MQTTRVRAYRTAVAGLASLGIALTGVIGSAATAFADETDPVAVTTTATPRRVWVTFEMGGTVIGGDEFVPGDQVKLIARPHEGFAFFGWIVNGVPGLAVSKDATLEFIMPDGPVTAFASFARVEDEPAEVAEPSPEIVAPSGTSEPTATETPESPAPSTDSTKAPESIKTSAPIRTPAPTVTPTPSKTTAPPSRRPDLRSQVSRTI